jgi:hypothetical protein
VLLLQARQMEDGSKLEGEEGRGALFLIISYTFITITTHYVYDPSALIDYIPTPPLSLDTGRKARWSSFAEMPSSSQQAQIASPSGCYVWALLLSSLG